MNIFPALPNNPVRDFLNQKHGHGRQEILGSQHVDEVIEESRNEVNDPSVDYGRHCLLATSMARDVVDGIREDVEEFLGTDPELERLRVRFLQR